jgi:methylated-DNA-[protein]-cysteine S-methyltransferase
MPLNLTIERVPTAIGVMLLVSDNRDVLRALTWEDAETYLRQRLQQDSEVAGLTLSERPSASDARRALEAYFDGDLFAIDRIPVETGGTRFQRDVWAALRTIPAGQTLSYSALASRIGRPKAVRAVGLANGANPIGIVIPCHRVIGADASLTGYGGGLDRKRWLLEHEGASFKRPVPPTIQRRLALSVLGPGS